MTRGTTPEYKFNLPINLDHVEKFHVNFTQGNDDYVIVRKTNEECESSENTITVRLTQEETYKFAPKKPAQVQLHILTKNGESLKTGIYTVDVGRSLGNEVLEK